MTPHAFLHDIIDPGLRFLDHLGGPETDDAVRRFLLAVALQESGPGLYCRFQNYPNAAGPARGWWMFEQGGGVHGVLNHAASKEIAEAVCIATDVLIDDAAVWRSLEGHDLLAVCFARLLVWTDPYPVPVMPNAGWEAYCDRLWRPGAPHIDTWPGNWAAAGDAVAGVMRT